MRAALLGLQGAVLLGFGLYLLAATAKVVADGSTVPAPAPCLIAAAVAVSWWAGASRLARLRKGW